MGYKKYQVGLVLLGLLSGMAGFCQASEREDFYAKTQIFREDGLEAEFRFLEDTLLGFYGSGLDSKAIQLYNAQLPAAAVDPHAAAACSAAIKNQFRQDADKALVETQQRRAAEEQGLFQNPPLPAGAMQPIQAFLLSWPRLDTVLLTAPRYGFFSQTIALRDRVDAAERDALATSLAAQLIGLYPDYKITTPGFAEDPPFVNSAFATPDVVQDNLANYLANEFSMEALNSLAAFLASSEGHGYIALKASLSHQRFSAVEKTVAAVAQESLARLEDKVRNCTKGVLELWQQQQVLQPQPWQQPWQGERQRFSTQQPQKP